MTVAETVFDKEQLAEYLRISVSTVERMMASNEIAYRKVGNQVRFLGSWALDYLERGKVKSEAEIEALAIANERTRGRRP